MHRHQWQIQRVDEMPSAFEQVAKDAPIAELTKAAPIYFRRKLVYWLKCLRCGKIKKTVETNP